MTSAIMDIADTMASDFLDAVRDAERTDMETIEKLMQEMNLAETEYFNKEALLQSKQEQAVRTLLEIADLRDVNHTTHKRRIEALREQMKEFKETKASPSAEAAAYLKDTAPNVVKLGG